MRKRTFSPPTHPKIIVSFDVLSVMCIIFVRLESDFNSLYAFEEALKPKLHLVILTVCAVRLRSCSTTGVKIMM